MIEKLQKDLLEVRDDHRNSKDRLRALDQQIETKAEKGTVEKVQEYLDLLPTKEEVVQLRNHMKTSIEKFTVENRDFTSEFHAHLAIIRRYDEVISDKASKHSVVQTESRLNDQYKPAMKDLDQRIQANLKLINDQKTSMGKFMEHMSSEIHQAVKQGVIREMKSIQHEKRKAQPKIMGINQLMNEGETGLLKVLSLKADADDLQKLHEMKANREDSENMMELIIEMNRLIQHVIVILSETLKINLIKANDTRLARENKSHDLIIQVHALA